MLEQILHVTEVSEKYVDINLRPKVEDGEFAPYRGWASEGSGRGGVGMFSSVVYCFTIVLELNDFFDTE